MTVDATGHAPRASADPSRVMRIARQATGAWVLLALGAIANGGLRQAVLSPWLGEGIARVLSIVILLVLIVAVSVWCIRAWWMRLPARALLLIGASWAVASALFEFGLGRLAFGMDWSELLAAYDLSAGQYWILAPIGMLVGPALAGRLLRRRST